MTKMEKRHIVQKISDESAPPKKKLDYCKQYLHHQESAHPVK